MTGLADWSNLSSARGTLIEQIQGRNAPPDMMIFNDPPVTNSCAASGEPSRPAV